MGSNPIQGISQVKRHIRPSLLCAVISAACSPPPLQPLIPHHSSSAPALLHVRLLRPVFPVAALRWMVTRSPLPPSSSKLVVINARAKRGAVLIK